MGIVRVVFIPILILMVAVAPIFCPCHDAVIGLTSPGVNPFSASRCADAPALASGHVATFTVTNLGGMACRCGSAPMCLDHLFKGVLRESAAATIYTHIGHSFIAYPITMMSAAGTSTFSTRPQPSLSADAGAKTLLRQHCALII